MDTGDGPWVVRALAVLAGCSSTVVVTGAAASAVATLVGPRSAVVVNHEYALGMASSLRVGLAAVPADADAALVMLVDLPDVTAAVADRLVAAAGPAPRHVLLRASYAGRPGHPVLVGAAHFEALGESLAAGDPDAGGARYLTAAGVRLVECGDLADGTDVDHPAGP